MRKYNKYHLSIQFCISNIVDSERLQFNVTCFLVKVDGFAKYPKPVNTGFTALAGTQCSNAVLKFLFYYDLKILFDRRVRVFNDANIQLYCLIPRGDVILTHLLLLQVSLHRTQSENTSVSDLMFDTFCYRLRFSNADRGVDEDTRMAWLCLHVTEKVTAYEMSGRIIPHVKDKKLFCVVKRRPAVGN